jgi:toxin-antitoxin system PIN domain toxin
VIIVDVNLLLYAVVDGFAQHERAHAWWVDTVNSGSPVGLGSPAIFGFLRLATDRRVINPPLTMVDARGHVRDWLGRSNVSFTAPGPRHIDIAFGLLEDVAVGGGLTTDVQLAALAIERDGTVYSHDTDFGRFPQVRWIDPLR